MRSSRLGLLALAAVVPSVCAPASPQTGSKPRSQTASKTAELRIRLSGHDEITRNRVRYTCGANAAKLNLPSGPFTVEYIAVGNNGLAIVPVDGERIIFSRVVSASGERFAAGLNEWGDKGPDAWLTSLEAGRGEKHATVFCREVR